MKKNIDRLMKERKIDAIVAQGAASSDPVMYYLLEGINVSGLYVKKRGERAVLVHNPMEREEAAKTGLKLISTNKYDLRRIYSRYHDRLKASACYLHTVLDSLKVRGTVIFYGYAQAGAAYHLIRQLLRFNRKIEIAYEAQKNLVSLARETKDEEEIRRIAEAGRGVVRAFNAVLGRVAKMKVAGDAVVTGRGRNLRIGELKQMMKDELQRNDLTSSNGMIIAQGRDAGIPHNSGDNRMAVRTGQTIVFDIYPQHVGGGYYFDFTRTVCLRHAPDRVAATYRLVKEAQDLAYRMIKVGAKTKAIETAVCKLFEENKHPTFLTDPKTETGYCHSLGHGVGLNVHESPTFGLLGVDGDRIEKGQVFTVEPGLYYPDQGFGVRLEDTVHVNGRGRLVNLTNCRRTLVVKM